MRNMVIINKSVNIDLENILCKTMTNFTHVYCDVVLSSPVFIYVGKLEICI